MPSAFPGGFRGFPPGSTGGFPRSRQRDPFRDQQLLRLGLVLVQQLMTMEKKPPVTILLLLGEPLVVGSEHTRSQSCGSLIVGRALPGAGRHVQDTTLVQLVTQL